MPLWPPAQESHQSSVPDDWVSYVGSSDTSFSQIIDDRSTDGSDGWFGVVHWVSRVPFTAGDSGSLVYAIESGTCVPLGIHVGEPDSLHEQSWFVSLDMFCNEGEEEGWSLSFPPL